MANSKYIRKVTITTEFAKFEERRTIFTGDISCPTGNSGNVTFEGDDGSEVDWIPGEWHHFEMVDLSTFRVKGTANDTVTLVGIGG